MTGGKRLAAMLANSAFPRSAKYDVQWVVENAMGPHPLWLAEWLCEKMDLNPGMRVLDMGCGKAITSIFLAKEYGVQVWANDLWIPATENWARIREAGLEDQIFPIHAEAHALPYAEAFFDAIVSIDSYFYYGTNDLYLGGFSRFVKPGGQIGIVEVGLVRDLHGAPPEHLTKPMKNGGVLYGSDCVAWHSPEWWRNHWAKTGHVDVEIAESHPEGWNLWLRFEQAQEYAGANFFPSGEEAIAADGGQYIGIMRMVARRKKEEQ